MTEPEEPTTDTGQIMGRTFTEVGADVHDYRITEVAPRTWFLQPSWVNVALFETDEGLVMVDAGFASDAATIAAAIRSVSDAPLHTVVYTHGHLDHAFGMKALLEAGENPQIVAHERVPVRFERYARTAEYNAAINRIQFSTGMDLTWPEQHDDFYWPDVLYTDRLDLQIGGEEFVCFHGMGETDDATYVWVPGRKVLACGDFWFNCAPNCGNPNKVQRYPEEWAQAGRHMAGLGAEILLPGHSNHQEGADHITQLFSDQAELLETIVEQTLAGLNAGLRHDEVVAQLEIPTHLAENPTLQPFYDRPEFIARNVIRKYGGWWNGYSSELMPAPPDARFGEIAHLAGGPEVLAGRAVELADVDLALACHVAEWAFLADPSSAAARDAVRLVFGRRAEEEESVMGKGVFNHVIRMADEAEAAKKSG